MGSRKRFRRERAEVRNERFTVLMQPSGTEALVTAHLCFDLATPEVAAFVGAEAGITSRYSDWDHPVGVYGSRVYLLTIVHLGVDGSGRWGHVGLADMARDQTEDLREAANGMMAMWSYSEALDRACVLIDRHENDLMDELMQAQNRLVDDFRAGGVPDGASDARGQAVRSLAALDALPAYAGRPPDMPDPRLSPMSRAERRRRGRR